MYQLLRIAEPTTSNLTLKVIRLSANNVVPVFPGPVRIYGEISNQNKNIENVEVMYLYIFQESLEKCLEKKDIEQLKASYAVYNVNSLDVKSVLDQTFRELLFKKVFQNNSTVDFVNLSVQAVRNDLVTSALPINLLGDIFDAVTLDESEKLFRYVEDNVGT